MLADFGIKLLVPLLHKHFKYWASGQRNLPAIGSKHYDLLQMRFYEQTYLDIV